MDIANYSFWIKISVCFFLCFGMQATHSTRTYSKDWAVANIIGPISENSSFKYYLEPQLRLIDTPSVFNQFLYLGGLGYQFNRNVMLFIGPGWILTKTPENKTHTEKRLWEQLNWQVMKDSNLSINSRTRLEERQRSDQSQIAFRLRERLWLRVPLKKWQSYSFSCFNEFFFNLNHPSWTSPYLFEQNRAFIGIAKNLSKTAILDIGYLNQFLHSSQNQNDNVLLLSLTMIR
ncbi:hypothetical protein Lste_1757 [Legionella steelei]|uniref:DUF2490 domain-containing protein n=1 Tax=Legionella steelei TaxID=947033 RepID=A0A0W0ZHP8_9GAMM|nr:DUF2490 domain-containing protein [Legionella steelei]KTD68599.1 hypothetical protein Lste_1757 [Legionella steelei]